MFNGATAIYFNDIIFKKLNILGCALWILFSNQRSKETKGLIFIYFFICNSAILDKTGEKGT